MELERELKELLIKELKIEDANPEDFDNDAPLFGEGWELDSLDAVELVMMINKRYGIEIKKMEVAREVLASINTLAEFIRQNGKADESG